MLAIPFSDMITLNQRLNYIVIRHLIADFQKDTPHFWTDEEEEFRWKHYSEIEKRYRECSKDECK